MIALFDSRAALLGAIGAAKARHLTIVTAFLPAYDATVIDAVGVPRAWSARIACAGGIMGGVAGLMFPAWAVQQWPRVIVGGKPLLSWPTFLIISFEMALLCAALAAVLAFLAGAWQGRRRSRRVGRVLLDPPPPSVSDATFALLIACSADRVEEATAVMKASGAVACRAD
jgi:hypothetical protein